MSLVEIIVVLGIIVVLVAILLPGLWVAKRNAIWASSQNNLKQIHTYMTTYAGDHRDTIVPAAFDYSSQAGDPRVKVRGPSLIDPANGPQTPNGSMAFMAPPTSGVVNPPLGQPYRGSWSDILWTVNKLGPVTGVKAGKYKYQYDSPDADFYKLDASYANDVFRSAAPMTKTVGGDGAIPFGTGSVTSEKGDRGYFAANNFFDLVHNGNIYYTMGQIKRPSNSGYLIDSYGGEVTTIAGTDPDQFQIEFVDYRYAGDQALILLLDGHVESVDEFETLKGLESGSKQIRFMNLDKQKAFWDPN
jgi:type II secretory pathway pseudopilin PulG